MYFLPVAKRSKMLRFCTDLPLTLAKAEYPWPTLQTSGLCGTTTSSEEQVQVGAHLMLFDSQGKAAAIKVRVRKHLTRVPRGLQGSEKVAF